MTPSTSRPSLRAFFLCYTASVSRGCSCGWRAPTSKTAPFSALPTGSLPPSIIERRPRFATLCRAMWRADRRELAEG